jgi:hypothetical protein
MLIDPVQLGRDELRRGARRNVTDQRALFDPETLTLVDGHGLAWGCAAHAAEVVFARRDVSRSTCRGAEAGA